MAPEGRFVGRTYAGILGPLAFAACLVHGLMHGGQPQSVLTAAWLCLLVFAVLGYVAGSIAERVVEQSVRSRVADELEVFQQQKAEAVQRATEVLKTAQAEMNER
jgi:hypothetical protein